MGVWITPAAVGTQYGAHAKNPQVRLISLRDWFQASFCLAGSALLVALEARAGPVIVGGRGTAVRKEEVAGKEAPLEISSRGLPECIRIKAKLSCCPSGEYLGRRKTAMHTRLPVAEPACTILFSISVARA
jgi:hypothetical protein